MEPQEAPAPVQALQTLRALAKVADALADPTTLEDLYEAALASLDTLLGAERSALLLRDPDGIMRCKAQRGLSAPYRTALEGHDPWAGRTADPAPVLVPDVASDGDLLHLLHALRAEGIEAVALFPLVARGQALGELAVYHATPHGFDELEVEVALTVARHVTSALERLRQQRTLKAQYAITGALADAADIEATVQQVLKGLIETTGWRFGAVWRLEAGGTSLRCVQTWADPDRPAPRFEQMTRELVLGPGVGLPGTVLQEGGPIWMSDAPAEPNFPRWKVALQEQLHAAVGVPIRLNGQTVGVMEMLTDDARSSDTDLVELVEATGRQIGQVLERRRAEHESLQGREMRAALFEASLDAVLTMDHEGRLIDMNDVAEQMFGHVRSDAIGRTVAELVVPPALRDAHRDGLRRYLRTGQGNVLGHRIEITAVRADGSEFPVELGIARAGTSEPPVFTGFVRDITDRNRRDAALRLLARAGIALGSSLDAERTLNALAELSISDLADISVAYIQENDDSIRRLPMRSAAGVDPEVLAGLEASPPLDPSAAGGVPEVLRTGRPAFHPEVTAATLAADTADPAAHARLIGSLDVSSWMCLPLRARGRTVGAVSFIATGRRRYDEADLRLAQDIAARAGLALDNAVLYRERDEIASTLQRRLLPPSLPPVPGVDVAVRYIPAGRTELVGGDFYDLFQVDEGKWFLLVGDVCGKGTAAAAVTAVIRQAVRACALKGDGPADALRSVNRLLLLDREIFTTACVGELWSDAAGVRVSIAAAGHPLPLLAHADGRVQTMGEPGSLLGAFDEVSFTEHRFEIPPLSVLLLYTDGVSEHRRDDGELFG
ncbi:MAG: GAF domain-containing protein, partial [Actinobacteria bacterium]|nr:GAF domain-containing protein [Actinomycetota bacterium]